MLVNVCFIKSSIWTSKNSITVEDKKTIREQLAVSYTNPIW